MKGTLGEIRMFGGDFAPKNWALCHGQILDINLHAALYSILGPVYGGDGRRIFALPDFRKRIGVHTGIGGGLEQCVLGEKKGVYEVALREDNLPPHSHSIISGSFDVEIKRKVYNDEASTGNPSDAVYALTDDLPIYSSEESDTTLATTKIPIKENFDLSIKGGGDSEPVKILPRLVAVNYIICIEGEYPARSSQ